MREGDRLTETIIQLRKMLREAECDLRRSREIIDAPPREVGDLELRRARKHLRSANTRILLAHKAIGMRMSSSRIMEQHLAEREEVNQ